MTSPFLRNRLRFFLTAPAPCPYLAGHQERKLFAYLPILEGTRVNDSLTQIGFRRSQNIAYRPACETCAACVSVRIPVVEYNFSRSEKRVLRQNLNLERRQIRAMATVDQYDLLNLYLKIRHKDGDMLGMSWSDYVSMIEDTTVSTHIIEYRADNSSEKLLACVLVDQLVDGLSLVYSFYDPAYTKKSLGKLIILDQIIMAQTLNLPYVYLGYLVAGSRKMAYKARFSPLEALKPDGWQILSDEERRKCHLNPEDPFRGS